MKEKTSVRIRQIIISPKEKLSFDQISKSAPAKNFNWTVKLNKQVQQLY